MNVGDRMKQRRKELRLSAKDVADKIGVNRSTVFRYEKGDIEKLPIEILEPLSEVLRTTPQFLMGWDEQPDIISIYNQLNQPRQQKVYNYAEHQLKEQNKVKETVQVYGSAAAGAPIDYVDGFVDEEEVETVPEGANRALRIKGNSMSPLLKDGQLVFYKAQPQLENGQVGIFEIHGEAVTCKRYKVDFDDQKIMLQSENPEYEDMIFNGNEVRILGEVKL